MMPYRGLVGRFALFAEDFLVCGMSDGLYLYRDRKWLGPFKSAIQLEAAAAA